MDSITEVLLIAIVYDSIFDEIKVADIRRWVESVSKQIYQRIEKEQVNDQ